MAEVRIESIAAGGDGVGRLDGLAVFTPRTAPGELVDVATRQQGRLARGRLLRILERSPHRVEPRCRHYDGDHCGGCQLQHLSMEAQLSAKQRIVQDAFTRIARRPVELPEIVPSPTAWEYRSRLTLAMRWRNGGWTMGLHRFDDVESIFDLVECPITDPRIVAAWASVRQASQWLPRARELRGTVRLAGSELALIVEGGDAWTHASEFADAVGMFDVIRWRSVHGPVRVIVDRRKSATPEQSFDQVNQPVAAAARHDIIERALAGLPGTAVDAYAGLGATALALAGRGVTVTAIESDSAAVRFAAEHLPANAHAMAARVEDVIAELLPADVVVLNPPRAGVHPRVTEALQTRTVPRLMYMSCDAATLARDVSRLPAYRVESLRAYDMFPQTAHVEVVCELIPEDA
ncbi:MAG TPA: methyltransferase [Gemmatimonadaceae bacterium]